MGAGWKIGILTINEESIVKEEQARFLKNHAENNKLWIPLIDITKQKDLNKRVEPQIRSFGEKAMEYVTTYS